MPSDVGRKRIPGKAYGGTVVVQVNALTPSAGGRGRVLPGAEPLRQAEVPGDTAAILPTPTVCV